MDQRGSLKGNLKYFELNEIKIQHVRKLRDASKAVLRGKLIVQMLTLEKKKGLKSII